MATHLAAVPSTPNRPARLNRSLLTLLGLVLLLAGAYAVLRGSGTLATGTPAMVGDPAASLVPAGFSVPGWLPWTAIVAGVLVGLLCLRWLLAQVRRRAHAATTWRFTGSHAAGSTEMDSSAAGAAITAEIETYSGVHRARAVLTGDRAHPQLHLVLAVTDDAPITEIRDRIDKQALPRLRQALELDALPTEVLLRLHASTDSVRAR